MPLTAQQIVSQACIDAKAPGMTSIGAIKLNAILQELCMTYDFDAARGVANFTFNQLAMGGSGPYVLPADYLRTEMGKQFYSVDFQPYTMSRIELWEYDLLTQQPGFNDFPRNFTVDMSTAPPNGAGAQEFVWPPPSISVPVLIRYYRLMPDIASPATSNVIPWFPYQKYLLTRLTGEMFQTTDDERASYFLTDKEEINPQGAGVLLRKYLNLKDDPEGRAKTVELDRRRFGIARWDRLPSTKTIGWPTLLFGLWVGDKLLSLVLTGAVECGKNLFL